MRSNLNKRIDRLEKDSASSIEEAMAWVEENNPAAAKVIRAELDNSTDFTIITNIPEPNPPSGK
jgi:hypothetical protein